MKDTGDDLSHEFIEILCKEGETSMDPNSITSGRDQVFIPLIHVILYQNKEVYIKVYQILDHTYLLHYIHDKVCKALAQSMLIEVYRCKLDMMTFLVVKDLNSVL